MPQEAKLLAAHRLWRIVLVQLHAQLVLHFPLEKLLGQSGVLHMISQSRLYRAHAQHPSTNFSCILRLLSRSSLVF